MAKRRHATPWFLIGLGLYTLALLTAIAVGLNIVTKKLSAYERSLPSHAADTVFSDYFSDNAARALAEFAPETDTYETKEIFAQVVTDLIRDKNLRYFETVVTDEVHRYTVAADDTRIAEFTLSPAEEKGKWRLDGITFSLKAEQEVVVTVYSGSTVYLNGVAVDESALEADSTDESHYSFNHMKVNDESEPLAQGLSTVRYRVGGLYTLPAVTVKDRRGRDCVVTGENGVYSAELLFDDDRMEEMRSTVAAAAEEYCLYMHLSSSYGTLGHYFDKTCSFYKNLRKASIWCNLDISTYDFATEEFSELYFYSEDVFSCLVHIDENVVPKQVNRPETYTLDARLFFRRTESSWLVYDVSFSSTL